MRGEVTVRGMASGEGGGEAEMASKVPPKIAEKDDDVQKKKGFLMQQEWRNDGVGFFVLR